MGHLGYVEFMVYTTIYILIIYKVVSSMKERD